MNVRTLIQVLETFDDDAEVFIREHNEACQVGIELHQLRKIRINKENPLNERARTWQDKKYVILKEV